MPSDSIGAPAPARTSAAQQRRARLLAATVDVAGERGWDGMSLAEVVARAGFSKRAVYEQFADRRECFLAAARDLIDRVAALTLAAYDAAPTPREGIAASIETLLRFCGEQPRAARVYLVETAISGAAGRTLWHEHVELMGRRAACALRGLRRDVPAESGAIAIGGLYSLAQTRVLEGRAAELPRQAPEITAAVWTVVGLT